MKQFHRLWNKGEREMYNREFKEIKKHLAFGMMRLPMKDDKIDNEQVCRMVDLFLEKGFNYFDTAHGYHDGLSEIAVKECLTSRHDRSEYILTDKLTDAYFKTEEDIRPLIDSQLEACGVEYFDFLLMHAQNAKNFEFFKQCRAYETAFDLKAEGKVRHVGLSFHDKATVLDRILTEYPEVEIVQIQFNYLDYENLPEEAQKALDDLRAETGSGCSNAGYALRFAAGFDGIEMVLSGMSNMEQMEDNIHTFSCNDGDFESLSDKELEAINKVVDVFGSMGAIPCTGCRYCVEENHCPMEIKIPNLFSTYNSKKLFDKVNPWATFENITKDSGKPAACAKRCVRSTWKYAIFLRK